ncbi:MAG: CpaF family protein [Phycisphaeraceae bacterium]|nr:CpaF family protein [Phycisphaeraceae bacterium]
MNAYRPANVMYNGADEKGNGASLRRDLLLLKQRIHRQLLDTMDMNEARRLRVDELHTECINRADALIHDQRIPLSGPEKQQLIREVMDEIFGLGPLEDLLREPDISDILVNGPKQVFIERAGRLESTDVTFRDNEHLMQVILRIAADVGRHIDESSPMLDARLIDGSRVNAIIPPLALDGPMMSIRRFGTVQIELAEMIKLGTMTAEMGEFLQACVQARMNILISGGTGAGKTTLLNLMSKWIPETERVVTIEDAAELRLPREHVVRLETRPPNIEGRGQVTQRDLLRNALRMRPDRIIIGEVRGAEAVDMLQAMNTGHEGSMTTVHANNPRDATRRVENMVSMAGLNFPVHTIREQMASALDILIHADRLTGGQRKIVAVCELTGMEGDQICMQDLFIFRQTGLDDRGFAKGYFEATGVRPQLLNRIHAEGVDLSPEMFRRRRLEPEA